jgi:general secretion pathway protein D
MPLSRFAGLVASKHKINIVVDNTIDKDNDIFYIESTDKDIFLLSPFRLLLKQRGYDLSYDRRGDYYFIQKSIVEIDKPRFLKLDAPVYDDLKSTLTMLGLVHSYIQNTHTLTYMATNDFHDRIKDLVFSNDDRPEQFKLKISILETNLNEVKSRGTQLQAYTQGLEGSTQFFLSLLTVPYSSTVNTFESSTTGITGALRYLNENSITKILSSPHFTVQSNKQIYFSSVQNIPYKTSESSVNGATQTTAETIDYKDVGLKIKLLPRVVLNTIYIDLDLVIDNITDKQSLTPTTSKRELKNSFQLIKGQVLVLSGLTQEEEQAIHYGIPFIEDIPVLGWFFKYESKEIIERNLTVTIEVI